MPIFRILNYLSLDLNWNIDLQKIVEKKISHLFHVLFIDFRKAFDLVDSKKLLRKLFHYGFDNSALDMIANYFTDRHQSVKYENKMSPLMAILLGVPQGSVLGPLFFLLMINDLAYILELMCKLFADDTTLGDVDKDLSTLINRFVNKLKTLLDWYQFNKLDESKWIRRKRQENPQ